MIIRTFVEPPIDNNNYLIIDEKSKEAALVDCSAFDPKINKELENFGAKLRYILLTHGHFDHIAGIRPNPDVKIFMHKADMEQLNQANNWIQMFGIPKITPPVIDVFIQDGDIISLGDLQIKVIHTPGHTQGGVCYLIEGNLFSGDTIFKNSIGRCDLLGGDFPQIIDSIEQKIFTLSDETVIYPGHGAITTVAQEKGRNF